MRLPFTPVQAVARQLPPFVGSRLRTHALRLSGFQMGHGSSFWGWPTLVGSGHFQSLLTIGAYCGFNVRCYFELEDAVTIGDHVSVGHEVMFLTKGRRVGSATQRGGEVFRAPIVVEEGAWLGARCTLLPGVRVGAGAVVGAMAVVTQDVPANTLLVGTQKISLAKWL